MKLVKPIDIFYTIESPKEEITEAAISFIKGIYELSELPEDTAVNLVKAYIAGANFMGEHIEKVFRERIAKALEEAPL